LYVRSPPALPPASQFRLSQSFDEGHVCNV
jgi:hypothetical protein